MNKDQKEKMRMYKVLLVDDEPWISYGLKRLIDWEGLGYTIIGEAINGIKALEIIDLEQPDVVISDIRMPGLDGIKLMEEIHARKLKTKVIIISGYAEFEYAQKAINFGAFDYLLKQVERDKLIEVMTNLSGVLDEMYSSDNLLNQYSNDLFYILSPYKDMKIKDFIENKKEKFIFCDFYFITCTLLKDIELFFDCEVQNLNDIKYMRFRVGKRKLIILANFNSQNTPNAPDILINALEDINQAGISSKGKEDSHISSLIREADIALNSEIFIPVTGIRKYELMENEHRVSTYLIDIERSIKERDFDKTTEYIDGFYKECLAGNFHIEQILIFYNQVITLAYKYYAQKSAANGLEYYTYYQMVDYYRTIHEFFDMLKVFFKESDTYEFNISNDTIKNIMKEIDSRFTEDISLQALSKTYNISIGYLSTLIKKETGHTYTEHIINKKLELAKQLLMDENLSINIIAEKVGYTDYFYFTKLFKKYCGVTPSKYRKL